MSLLAGKVIVVCGAGVSLGRETVAVALREGAEVVFCDIDGDQVARVQADLDPSGTHSLGLQANMVTPGDAERVAERAGARFGRCDGLIQTAAVFGGGTLMDGDFDDYANVMNVNFLGTLRMIRAMVPLMRLVGGGSIVIIGSTVAHVPTTEFPETMPYAASKGALTSASHYLARELGGDGIRVNTVLPGFKWGARLQHTVPLLAKQLGIEPEELIERFRARLALYRFADDESVANASVFFCSEYAKNITGQQLVVDGGGLLH